MDNAPLQGNALQAAIAQNQRIHQELKQLSDTSANLMGWSPDYANYYPNMIARLQGIYRDLRAAYITTLAIQEEGVLEVTVRSRTHTFSWPIPSGPGGAITDSLMEYFALAMQEVEDKIIEARGRMAADYGQGTAEEWHLSNARYVALLLEQMPTLPTAA